MVRGSPGALAPRLQWHWQRDDCRRWEGWGSVGSLLSILVVILVSGEELRKSSRLRHDTENWGIGVKKTGGKTRKRGVGRVVVVREMAAR